MKFKIYPTGDKAWYFQVIVRSTRKSMAAVMKSHGVPVGKNTLACCIGQHVWSFRKGKRAKREPHIGTIYFNREHLTAEIVAHECMHAVFRVLGLIPGAKKRLIGRGKNGWVNDTEEFTCTVVDGLMSQCFKHLKT